VLRKKDAQYMPFIGPKGHKLPRSREQTLLSRLGCIEKMIQQETLAEGLQNYTMDPGLLCTPSRVEMKYNLLDPIWLSQQALTLTPF